MKKTDQSAEQLRATIQSLEHAMQFRSKVEKDEFYFSGIAKNFEVCFEYAWKYLQDRVQEEGIDIYSPKEAIKQAGRLGMIESVEKWLGFLEDRNLAVHNYLGLTRENYLDTIQEFLIEVKRLLK